MKSNRILNLFSTGLWPTGLAILSSVGAHAQQPTLVDPNLAVRVAASRLEQPVSMAFPGDNDFFVLEKASGKVQHIVNGALQSTALDLPVNSASERGLLGIALHPDFPTKNWVYLFWTESLTGADSTDIAQVPLLGNRVDRFTWNGFTLTYDKTLIHLHAYQADAGQPLRGNHDGGVLRFEHDSNRHVGDPANLFIIFGDNGRRGFMQNNMMGPVPDDQFGGPKPDNAHLTGVILRLRDDGSTPDDNPFFDLGDEIGGAVGDNIQRIFAYGVRNSFGMDIDPRTGTLWTQENGDDSFDEINRVTPGFNGGWVQIVGPVKRIAQYKAIEVASGSLQQLRWPPTNIANTPTEALSRLYNLPDSHYHDPEFSWKYAIAPAGIGFVRGTGLGAEYEGNLFVGAARLTLANGYLLRFKFTSNRKSIDVSADARLRDHVADNFDKFDPTESESLIVGQNFGVVTDFETGPNGHLYMTSLLSGNVFEIYRR